ncbi:MAG TPA: hypothetical protein VKA34_13920 [Balneolales bacterium]|nr:hypothetical protein [Balneolales bacterium]
MKKFRKLLITLFLLLISLFPFSGIIAKPNHQKPEKNHILYVDHSGVLR